MLKYGQNDVFVCHVKNFTFEKEKKSCVYTNNVLILSYKHYILHDQNLMKQLHFNDMIDAK